MRKQLTIIWDGRFIIFCMKSIEKESSLITFLGCKQIISTVKGVINGVSVYGRCVTINENLREVYDHLKTRGEVCVI